LNSPTTTNSSSPHKDGIAIIAALANAERLSDSYSNPKRITEVERDLVTTKLMSNSEYERYKIAGLLQISPDEVKEMMEAANKPTPPVTP
jgi:hypothetical protein